MTAAEQHHEWGASVDIDGDKVILQVGKDMAMLTAREAQHFAFYLANAYLRAGKVQRSASGNLVIAR